MKINIFLKSEKQVELFDGCSTSGRTSGNIQILDDCKCKGIDERLFDLLRCIDNDCEDEYMLFCSDKILSIADSTRIYDIIENFLDEECIFDIFFLFRFLDRCDLYDNIREYDFYKIIDVHSPYGTECLLFSPSGKKKFRDYFTHETKRFEIDFNHFVTSVKCCGITPNLISFNIRDRDNEYEIAKTCECREIGSLIVNPENCKSNNGFLGFFWFVFILLIIILIAWFLLSLGYDLQTKSNPVKVTSPYPPMDPVGDLSTYSKY